MISSQLLRQSRSLTTTHSVLRTFTSDCAPAQKLKEVFESYRLQHFSRETPTRFRKELVKSIESGGVIKKDTLNQTLINIGCSDKLLSEEEFQVLLKDVGEDRALSPSEMMQLF